MRRILLCLFFFSPILILGQINLDEFLQPGKAYIKFEDHVDLDKFSFDREFKGIGELNYELNYLIDLYQISDATRPFNYPDKKLQQIIEIKFLPGKEIELIEVLNTIEGIEFAELVPRHKKFFTPDDLDPDQYALTITQAENAWNFSQGSSTIPIAIVDDGFRMNHEDLSGNIYTNPNEIPGNGIDDDGNGYVDDVNGWDAADNDPDPNPGTFSNNMWTHGTHVAGIAAATTNNSIGIASIGFSCSFIPVKSTNVGNGWVTHGYEGIDYAINTDARVISLSWGGYMSSATGQILIDAANAAGKVVVAAAGNDNTTSLAYPASFDHVISVGASDQSDLKAGFSNYGATIDVMAPGVDILSCLAGSPSSYGDMSGTSMACPFVSGLCGLMLTSNPLLSPEEVEDCLESTCDNIYPSNPGFNGLLGAGRVNAEQAMICTGQLAASFDSNFQLVCPGGQVQFFDQSVNDPTSWLWSFPGGVPNSSTAQNPIITYPNPGTYNVSLVVSNATDSDDLVINGFITVATPTAELSGSVVISQGMDAFLEISFEGNPPFDFTISDGTTIDVYNGIIDNPFYIQVNPSVNTTYQLTSFNDALCAGNFSGIAQITVLPPPPIFECFFTNLYGDGNDNSFLPFDLNPLDNSVYVAGGHNGDAMLSHINTDGSLNWAKTYSGLDGGRSVVRAPNGDILTVFRDPGNQDYHVLRTDQDGNVIWLNEYDVANDRFPRMVQSVGDSYIVAGWTTAAGVSDNLLVFRIDQNGDVIWSQAFNEVDDQMSDIIPDGNGGCFVSGGLHIVGGNLNYFIIHIDANGNVVGDMEFDSDPVRDDNPYLALTPDGGLAVAGQTRINGTLDFFVSKLDANLNHEWSFVDPISLNNDKGFDVISDDAGNMYFSLREQTATGHQAYVYKMTTNGELIWAKRMLDMGFLSLKYNNSGGSNSIVGVSRVEASGTFYGGQDGMVFHTDTALSSCLAEDYIPNLQPIIWAEFPWNYNVTPVNVDVTPITTNQTDLNYNFTELCSVGCQDSCSVEADFLLSDTLLCASTTVDMTNLSIGATDYSWLLDGIEIDNSLNTNYLFEENGIYTVTLIAQDSTCFEMAEQTVEVTILETEVIQDSSICVNDSIQLFASGGTSYSWSPTAGLSDPGIANPMASPSSSTIYTVTIYDGSCNVQETVELTVDPNCCLSYPIVDFDPNLCPGEQLILNNNSLTTGSVLFEWDFGPDLNPSSYAGFDPPPITPLTLGQLEFTLTITDDCGVTAMEYTVNSFDLPFADAGPDTLLCDASLIEIGTSPITYHNYLWQPSIGLTDPTIANPQVSIDNQVEYIMYITSLISGCTNSDTVLVTVFNQPFLGADISKCEEDLYQLNADYSDGFSTIEWSDGSSADSLIISEAGEYWIEVSNYCGTFQDVINVETFVCDCDAWIPNTITPNGDGLNDHFLPILDCPVQDYHLEIWNRWGQKIFETNDINEPWRAVGPTDVNFYVESETFVWRLNYVGFYEPLDNTVELFGHINVLR